MWLTFVACIIFPLHGAVLDFIAHNTLMCRSGKDIELETFTPFQGQPKAVLQPLHNCRRMAVSLMLKDAHGHSPLKISSKAVIHFPF